MRIPLTDKFLWDLYNFFEKLKDVTNPPEIFKIRSWNEICNPEYSKYWRDYRKKINKKHFGQFINYLKKNEYIKIKNLEKEKGFILTPKGKDKAIRLKYKLNPKLKRREDKQFIMVIFDIPEKKRSYRNVFRKFLYSLGFKKLQQSVWISPYEVYEDLEEIIKIYSLDNFVRIFLIKEIEI